MYVGHIPCHNIYDKIFWRSFLSASLMFSWLKNLFCIIQCILLDAPFHVKLMVAECPFLHITVTNDPSWWIIECWETLKMIYRCSKDAVSSPFDVDPTSFLAFDTSQFVCIVTFIVQDSCIICVTLDAVYCIPIIMVVGG